MTNCRDMEGTIAASLYEVLAPVDQQALQAHLDACAACRAEYASLQGLVGAMPNEPAIYTGNLLPAIREELRATAPAPRWLLWKRGLLAIAAVVVLSCLFLLVPVSTVEAPVATLSPLEATLAEAQVLAASEDPARARAYLETAIAESNEPLSKGLLQLAVADLEYDVFRRYSVAYNSYKAVRESAAEAWSQSPGFVKERFDLLTEAREANFEPLYQIDAALKQGDAGLPVLEQVMARYPGRGLAQVAMETMVTMADGDGLGAWEDVKSRCSNPVAIAQLDVRLGEGYCADNADSAKGRALLHAVAESPYDVPAKMAKDVLARLEAGEVN